MAFASTDWGGIGDTSLLGGTQVSASALTKLSGQSPLGDPGLIIDSGSNPQTAYATSLGNEPVVDGNCGTTSGEYSGGSAAHESQRTVPVGPRVLGMYLFL